MSRWTVRAIVLVALAALGCSQRTHHGPLRVMDAGPPPPVHDAGPPDSGSRVDAGFCAESPCRLVAPQCGCAAGEGCSVDGTGEIFCNASGTGDEGEGCVESSDCRPGLMCLGVSTTSIARCARFCETDADCADGPGSLCLQGITGSSGGELRISLCTASCDPVTGSGCPSGTGCGILQENAGAMRLLTECIGAGTRGTGQSCTSDEDCRAGHFCGDAGSGNVCIRVCRYPSSAACSSGSCREFATPIRVGGVEYGYCA